MQEHAELEWGDLQRSAASSRQADVKSQEMDNTEEVVKVDLRVFPFVTPGCQKRTLGRNAEGDLLPNLAPYRPAAGAESRSQMRIGDILSPIPFEF